MKDSSDSHPSGVVKAPIFCRGCNSPLVQAVDWQREDETLWSVTLWCPECGHEQPATLDRSQLLYLSMAMEEGFVWMLDALSEFDAVPLGAGGLDFAHRAQTDRLPPVRR